MTDVTTLPDFIVTPAAIAAIDDLGGAVRIDVEPGGCCGTTYAFARVPTDAPASPDDRRYGCPGAWLYVSQRAAAVLTGARLDYSGAVRPPRFRVTGNPNTAERCPCRRSFGAAWPGAGQPTCRSYEPMPWDHAYEPPRAWQRRTGWRPGEAGS